MRATEAGSHRASGHRIENAPLIEYQMFQSNMLNAQTFLATVLELCSFKTRENHR
jgi:hypothetical protein